jgi:hypothetical protein
MPLFRRLAENFKFSQIYILSTALLLSSPVVSLTSSFGNSIQHFQLLRFFSNYLNIISFLLNPYGVLNTFVVFISPDFIRLSIFYPSGVRNASHCLLNPTHISLKNLYNTKRITNLNLPFRGQGAYFFNSNNTAAVIIIFAKANGINFFQPRFINWS